MANVGSPLASIWLSPSDRATLEGWISRRNTPPKVVWRARVVTHQFTLILGRSNSSEMPDGGEQLGAFAHLIMITHAVVSFTILEAARSTPTARQPARLKRFH
jgi:hypothetical protein